MQKKAKYGMNLSIPHLLYINTSKDSSLKDYYPFGMVMPERNFSIENYRYGFNSQEKVDEISGAGNHNTAMFWEYDTRLGRRWNIEPLIKKYPSLSSYQTLMNNPIKYNDPDGKEPREGGIPLFINLNYPGVYAWVTEPLYKDPWYTSVKTIYDLDLFNKAEDISFAKSGIELLLVFPSSELTRFDKNYQNYEKQISNWIDASASPTYKYAESKWGIVNGKTVITQVTERTVANLGEGFESEVTNRDIYDVNYSKEGNASKILRERTTYTLNYDEDQKKHFYMQVTRRYDENGKDLGFDKPIRIDVEPRKENTKKGKQ